MNTFITVWKDPDFDPKQRAVYYARVIEIPTPRWTAYEAVRYGITMPKEVRALTHHRSGTRQQTDRKSGDWTNTSIQHNQLTGGLAT